MNRKEIIEDLILYLRQEEKKIIEIMKDFSEDKDTEKFKFHTSIFIKNFLCNAQSVLEYIGKDTYDFLAQKSVKKKDQIYRLYFNENHEKELQNIKINFYLHKISSKERNDKERNDKEIKFQNNMKSEFLNKINGIFDKDDPIIQLLEKFQPYYGDLDFYKLKQLNNSYKHDNFPEIIFQQHRFIINENKHTEYRIQLFIDKKLIITNIILFLNRLMTRILRLKSNFYIKLRQKGYIK